MILLIDNYDSFVFNLYQLVGSLYESVKILRNDAMKPEAMASLKPRQSSAAWPSKGCRIHRRYDPVFFRKDPYFRRMPGTSGYLSGFRRACIICKRADAWKKIRHLY